MTNNPVLPGTKTFLTVLSLVLLTLLLGCAPRPPTWPPSSEAATWHIDATRFQNSAHGNLACEACHTDITPGDSHPDTANLTQDATALYDYSTCQECHPQEYAAYESGVHATARAHPEDIKSGMPAPTCGHCHDAHYVTAETRVELLSSVNERCSTCHTEAGETYEHNYHGQTALLGYEQTATCTDCHGAHDVLALYEPDEAVEACRRCHPQANEQMVGFTIHARETLDAAPDDPRAGNLVLFFWVKLFFTVLVVGVLAFFYAHTGLWFLRSLHERLRGGRHD